MKVFGGAQENGLPLAAALMQAARAGKDGRCNRRLNNCREWRMEDEIVAIVCSDCAMDAVLEYVQALSECHELNTFEAALVCSRDLMPPDPGSCQVAPIEAHDIRCRL